VVKKSIFYVFLIVVLAAQAGPEAKGPPGIRWMDFSQGQSHSKQAGKTMVLYFYSDTCPSCTEMEKNTWKDARIAEALNTRYTPIKVNVDRQKQIAATYKVYYLPTTWFVEPDGQPLGNRVGYIPPDLLLKIFKHLPEKTRKTPAN